MEILLLIFIFHFVVGQLIENLRDKGVLVFFNNTLLFVILLFTVGITSTADWKMYRWFYNIKYENTDFMYYWLTLLFNKFHWSFVELFQFHMVVINLLYYFLITRFTKNFFYVMLAFMVINYVHSVNQIRYFMGFPILCLGYYYLFLKKQIVLPIFLFIVAYLCHSALSVLFIFIPIFFFIPIKRYLQFILIGSILFMIILLLIFKYNFGVELNHFGDYLKGKDATGFLGGLYNAFPYIIYFVFLYIQTNQILKIFPEYKEDKNFVFLYKISFFPIIFIPVSFMVQILGHRYVIPFLIFWIIYFLYLTKDLGYKDRFVKFLMFGAVHLVSGMFFYIFPDYVLKDNHFLTELETTVQSIKYLKFLF